MKKKLTNDAYDIINIAFEELDTYPELNTLVGHILKSIEVKEVKVFLPSTFKTTLIKSPDVLVPVRELVIGNVVFSYVRDRAKVILESMQERIGKINQNKFLSFTDKVDLLRKVKVDIQSQYRYFDTMNPIRYLSRYNWVIVYTKENRGKTVEKRDEDFPNSKIDLQEEHFNILDNAFIIRKYLLSEMLYLIDVELTRLEEDLKRTSYKWLLKEEYEIHELLVALLAIDRMKYLKGNEKTFIHDFLSLFGVSDQNFAYKKGKVLQRIHRSHFLEDLTKNLESFGKPTKKKSLK